MAEFLVGLVCIMLVVVGLQQIDLLSRRGFEAMSNARHQLASDLMDPTFVKPYNYAFCAPPDSGVDTENYTADDRTRPGFDAFYQDMPDGYLEKVRDADIGDYLTDYDRDIPDYDLKYSTVRDTSERLQMFHGYDQQAVDVVPFLDRILGKDTLYIGREVWMTRLDRVMQ